MAYFRYKLISTTGKITSGTRRLPYTDIISAMTHLERDGSIAINVRMLDSVSSFIVKLINQRRLNKFTRSDQAELASNLALMLRSGISLTATLQELSKGADMKQISGELEDIILQVQGGASFSQAAKFHKKIFPKTVTQLIQIGEETGQLDIMLKNGSDHLKNIQNIYSDTKQALLYPAFVFIALIAGLLFWFYFVVPKIITLFRDMNVKLPTMTIVVVNISNFVQAYFFYMIFGFILTSVLVGLARKKSLLFRKFLDRILLKLPVSGNIISASNLAFITEYFSLLISSGIELIHSINILIDSISNEIFREKLKGIREGLAKGDNIADCFERAKIFPHFVIRMIRIGEKSGTLSEQLDILAGEYRNKLSVTVSTIGKVIEPVVLIIAGIMFAIIIGALFLPIYDLIGAIS